MPRKLPMTCRQYGFLEPRGAKLRFAQVRKTSLPTNSVYIQPTVWIRKFQMVIAYLLEEEMESHFLLPFKLRSSSGQDGRFSVCSQEFDSPTEYC